jgi:hypothetical protein
MLRCSSIFRLDFILQHCHPDDVARIAADFDALIRELLEDVLGSKLDEVRGGAERVALSVRNGGFGLRSREALRGPAAIGVLTKTVRRLLPTDVDGGILNGKLTAIVGAVGRGSFDDGNYDLSTFLASGSRHAAFLASWWPDVQSYVSGTVGRAALAKDVEQAGMGFSNLQHALTSQLEFVARGAHRLPPARLARASLARGGRPLFAGQHALGRRVRRQLRDELRRTAPHSHTGRHFRHRREQALGALKQQASAGVWNMVSIHLEWLTDNKVRISQEHRNGVCRHRISRD